MPVLCRFHVRFRAAAGAIFPLLALGCSDTLGPSACLSGMSFVVGTAPAPALVTGSTYRLTLYVWLENPIPPSQRQALDSVDFVP